MLFLQAFVVCLLYSSISHVFATSPGEKFIPDVCQISSSGFHVVRTPVSANFAEQVCELFGWRLAAVDDFSAPFAIDTMKGCGQENAWMAAFNGLNRQSCMYFSARGQASTNYNGNQFCNVLDLPVLCQDVPSVLDVLSFSTVSTQTSGTATTSTTVTRHPKPTNIGRCDGGQCAFINKNAELDDDCCGPVLYVPESNLRIIKQQVSWEQARAACAKHNWRLASVYTGMYEALYAASQELDTDLYSDVPMWTDGFEGVSGGMCSRLFVGKDIFIYYYLLTAQECSAFETAYPVCQCDYWPVGRGPYQGSTRTDTTSSTSTRTISVPSTVLTVTSTVCIRCAPASELDQGTTDNESRDRHHWGHSRRRNHWHNRPETTSAACDQDFF